MGLRPTTLSQPPFYIAHTLLGGCFSPPKAGQFSRAEVWQFEGKPPVPGVAMMGSIPNILGHDPIFKGSWRLQDGFLFHPFRFWGPKLQTLPTPRARAEQPGAPGLRGRILERSRAGGWPGFFRRRKDWRSRCPEPWDLPFFRWIAGISVPNWASL